MLREIKNIKQYPNESKRRCFSDDFFDLTVWLYENNCPSGFQLCYREGEEKKALTYQHGQGFMHNAIDDGEENPGTPKMIPILTADGKFNQKLILTRLQESIQGLKGDIAGFVVK